MHLAYHSSQFLLWAESPLAGHDDGIAYPYQSDRDALEKALIQLEISTQPAQLHGLDTQLWVPTAGGRPSSAWSPLISAPSPLRPWGLAALRLPVGKVIAWLQQHGAQTEPAPGLTHGAEWAVWHQLLRLAGSLVVRQRLLPDLEHRDQGWHASWQPILNQPDHLQLDQLAQALPGVVQALTPDPQTPPVQRSHAVLREALQRLTDGLVRQAPPPPGSTPTRRRLLSAPERWLQALGRRNSELSGDDADLQQFQQQIRSWSRDVRLLAEAPFQLVLQLEEPGETNDHWYLRYLLQPREDPSLYLPLEILTAALSDQPDVLRQATWPAADFVRVALELAAQRSSLFRPSLAQSHPLGLELSLPEVEQLLQAAPQLQQTGLGMRLPAWWMRGPQPLRARARFRAADPAMPGLLSLQTLVEADWQLMLGDASVSLHDLEDLAQLKSGLIQWNGQWIRVEADALSKAWDFWRKRGNEPVKLQELLAWGPEGEGLPCAVEDWESTGWLRTTLEELQGTQSPPEIAVPERFIGTLRPYQLRGLNWLVFLCGHGLGACLADDMGLGKTIQTLAMLQHFRDRGETRPTLLICPTSLLNNWLREAERFVPELNVWVHHGSDRLRGSEFAEQARQHTLVITSYSLLSRDADAFHMISWAGIILDEAQNIKNPQTKQSRTTRVLSADWRLALTGTPVENHVGDLWAVMDFLNPGLLGTQRNFQTRYLSPIQRWRDKKALNSLQRLTAPFVLRRLKTDRTIIADLPDKLEMKVHCTLTKEQASLYMAVLQEIEAGLNNASGISRRGQILAALIRLKQICNHPAQYLKESASLAGRSGKMMRLQEMLEEILEVNEKSLVFTQFAEMGQLLQQHLQQTFDEPVLLLHGGTAVKDRPALIERFQTDAKHRIFVLSLKAGGTGLNLTAASHVFHYDRWWNPAVENQATDRAFRIGQTRTVQVHKFLCSGTLEERIDQMIERKLSLAESVIGNGENWLTELSNDELRALFALNLELVEH
ncbi:MAG: DEAD/DEAH box helicase [Candidatus Sericytochromatia bacterium]